MRFPENGGGDMDDSNDEASDNDGYRDDEEETEEEEAFRKRQELKAKLRGPYVQDLERKTAELWDEIHKYKQQKTWFSPCFNWPGARVNVEQQLISLTESPPL